jgi:archaeal flagellar protein FlaI
MNKKIIDEYTVTADLIRARVKIWNLPDETVPRYEICLPELGPATEALVSNIKDEIADKVPIEIEGVTDPKKFELVRQNFLKEIRKVVASNMSAHDQDSIDIVSGIMLHRMYGLGFVELMMADNWLEELALNGADQPITIYHKKHGWCKTTKKLDSEEHIFNLATQIGRKVGREINSLNPIMDAHLLTGDRVAATLFPISTAGNTITIRRFARNPWTIIHFISPEQHTLSTEMAALLWQAVHYELNVLVAGGTASGKTSLLSALAALMPPTQRVISIEDTREISLPAELHWNWVPLTTRNANPEGQGEVTMLDLMISSLRMRPDRILVGEVRRKAQAETMFEAMHTGHSVYTTMHADTVDQVKRRLTEPPIQIPKAEVEALQIVLIQFRDRRKGLRRTLELAEILSGNKDQIETNYLYRWHPRNDAFERASDSVRLVEEINLRTGMTPKEIAADLKERAEILDWMLKNNLKEIDEVGNVMRMYYKDRKGLLKLIKSGVKPKIVKSEGRMVR